MLKSIKSVLFWLMGLIIAGGIGYGVYSYINHIGFFASKETEMTEVTETEMTEATEAEVAIGE